MGRWRSSGVCERAAQWISMELDGELTEFERASLARHLEGCVECRESQTLMDGITRALRESEAVAAPAAPRAPLLPRRRLLGGRRAAAVFAVAATVGSLAAALVLPEGAPPPGASVLASATPQQRLQFAAAEHARIDAQVALGSIPRPSPFEARVLVESV